jgi:hypothetical protein
MTRLSSLHSVALACLLIALAAVWPVSRSRPTFTAQPVAHLPDADRARLETQLDLLRAAGYRIGPTVTHRIRPQARWWDRLRIAQAQTLDDGHTSTTALNPGDPATVALWTYSSAVAPNGTPLRMWGGVAFDGTYQPQTWGEGIVFGANDVRRIGRSACRSDPTFPSLTATLFARRDSCSMSTTEILGDGVVGGLQSAGLAYPFCWGGAQWCLGYAWLAGFNVSVYSDVYWLLYNCSIYM